MAWMATTRDRRADPSVLWPEARTVIALGANYGPDDDPLAVLSERGAGAISVYARNRDYHDVLQEGAEGNSRAGSRGPMRARSRSSSTPRR